jgi:hypothetical protein
MSAYVVRMRRSGEAHASQRSEWATIYDAEHEGIRVVETSERPVGVCVISEGRVMWLGGDLDVGEIKAGD